LRQRPEYPGDKERKDILWRGRELREEIKKFRKKYRIKDPQEEASGSAEEVR
jgi:hypothetical protein